MTELMLTAEEVVRLTGKKRPKEQMASLRRRRPRAVIGPAVLELRRPRCLPILRWHGLHRRRHGAADVNELVPKTRAQELGISPKTLRARSIRSINAARKHLLVAALPFGEIDNTVQMELDALLGEFDAFIKMLDESVEWLNLPFDEEPP